MNRACRELAQTSPSIQYEVDLFAVGLKRNLRIDAPLADCRQALAEYLKRWQDIDPREKLTKELGDRDPEIVVIGGVYGYRLDNCVSFFGMGSSLRDIPRREWQIPLGDIEARDFAFYPPANVLAIAVNPDDQRPWL